MFIIYQVHLSSNKGYHEALKKKSMAPIHYDDTSLHVIRWRFWRQFNDPDNGLAGRLWMHEWWWWWTWLDEVEASFPPRRVRTEFGQWPAAPPLSKTILASHFYLPPCRHQKTSSSSMEMPYQVPFAIKKKHFLLGYKLFSYQDHYSWPIKNNPFLAFLPPSEIPATE